MEYISAFCVPLIILIIIISGFVGKVKIYDAFMDGAKEGLVTIFKIFPALVGLIVSVGMLRASGTLGLITNILKPLTEKIQMPSEVVPLALMRPLSGSGAIAILTDIFKNYSPDSFIGRCASVMMGSTETTFYTIAIYFGSVGINKVRHTIKSALIADFTGIVFSVVFTLLLLGK
jgi:spore maturation protein B